jgi:hypothetical protein
LSVRSGGELSTKQLQKMVQALPQYSDQIDKLTLHVEVSSFVLHDMHLQTQQTNKDNISYNCSIYFSRFVC